VGLKSRNKGKDGEREVCEILRPAFPNVCRRLGQEREAVDNGRDLDGTEPFVFQVKRHARVSPVVRLAALAEAKAACRRGPTRLALYPVAVWREDHGGWRVTCQLGTLMGVVSAAWPTAADDALVVEVRLDDFVAWWMEQSEPLCVHDVANSQQVTCDAV
jgi:hypothetical protein